MTRLEVLRRRLGAGVERTKPMTATVSALARVPTQNGSRYLQQLCKHWSHDLAVEFTPQRGTVRFPAEGRAGSFPDACVVTFAAQSDALEVRIEASAPAQRDAIKGVVARHLDRFAFREAPLAFDWRGDS